MTRNWRPVPPPISPGASIADAHHLVACAILDIESAQDDQISVLAQRVCLDNASRALVTARKKLDAAMAHTA